MQAQGEIHGWAAVGIGLGFLFLTIAIFVVLGIATNRGARRAAVLLEEAAGGMSVPLVAAFTGWKGVPWIALAQSSLAPRLILHERDFQYQVIRLKRRPYADLSAVDLRTTLGTVNIVLEFRNEPLTFAGNTASREIAAKALALLAAKGCPLTPRARALLPAEGAADGRA